MTENVENLILERLKRIDQRLGTMEGDIQDLKIRMTAMEEHMAGLFTSMAGVHSRLDRFDERLSRVEKRLDLQDAN
ncbi:hypothetical protein [Alterisphingorhabdus coralli]|uniref:Uncharacterized protein n=1 Tax=Alterisphingorhabdus coralli TaxID=3071408 RepID=A0AA97F413_9SPHN|nr:hypothetical protein [Parasphingorhabdus sp. SCSIO 66989]WOE73919.1 hypothetical protein RB602_08585 [Parasphingorhabdus sp. SCSIO 66989]